MRRLPLLALLALPLLLTACDTAEEGGGENVFTLPGAREVEFRFAPAQFNPGQNVEIASVGAFRSGSILTNGTFTYAPSEVVSARIDGGVLLLLDQPIQAMLSTYQLTSIALRLEGGGATQEIALRTDFSGLAANARRVDLPVTNANVTRFLQQEQFSASLLFTFGNAPTARTEFSVEFDVRIEVEA